MPATNVKTAIVAAIALTSIVAGAADANHKNILRNSPKGLSQKAIDGAPITQTFVAPLKLACSIFGSPITAPNDLLIWEHYGKPVPAGTKIKWILPVHGKSGIVTLPFISPGDKYAKSNVVPGGAAGVVPCAVVVL